MEKKTGSAPDQETDFEIEIDENGDLLLTRDHILMVEIARLVADEDEIGEFEEFYNQKPLNVFGKRDYKSFCG